MSSLFKKTEQLAEKVSFNNRWRQRECFNLIPSETTPSLLVKMCEISDPSGRYAEHKTIKGKEIYFYQGIDMIKEIEEQAREELKKYFQCENVELRPISGQMANEVVFKAMVRFLNRGRPEGQPRRKMKLVMNNDLNLGGHLSSQPFGALFNYVQENPETGKEKAVNFPVMKDNPYKMDTDRLKEMLNEYQPELMVFGKSMFIYPEPVETVANLVKDWEKPPVIMFDMAHVLGLYGAFQAPLEEGAHIVTGSTHKTFYGPQRGLVAGNFPKGSPLRKLWIDIKGRAFPGSTSNHHLGTLVGLLMSAFEMNEFKKEYQKSVRKNAKSFARFLKDKGIQVEGDESDGFTETHQVLIRVKKYGNGMDIARRLEENNIIANYQALPDDETFLEPSGIRMGVQEMTRFGMKEQDFDELSGYLSEVVIHNKKVKQEVKKFRENFLEMKYCLEPEKAVPLAAQVFGSLFSYSDFADSFTKYLKQ